MAFAADGQLDPRIPVVITCIGKKRSGKSVLARVLFCSWPGDRVIIDPNGHDGPIEGTVPMPDPVPKRWPEHLREDARRPLILRYVPDPASPTFVEDMDDVIGLASAHGDTMVLVHEMGLLAPSGQTPPHTRRALHQGRHRRLSLIMCAPRPVTMDPLVLAQSDLVYVFKLPNPADRRRVAEVIGWDPSDLDAAVHGLAAHEYLRYDDAAPEPEETGANLKLLHFPALPDDVVRRGERAE